MMEVLNSRFKHLLVFLIAALVTAGLLRHTVHIYGGVAPEDIRKGALIILAAVAFIVLALTLSRNRHQD
jgi:hypothetical protein